MLPGSTDNGIAPPDCKPHPVNAMVAAAQPVDEKCQSDRKDCSDHKDDRLVEFVAGVDEHAESAGTDEEAQGRRANGQHQ